jgi:hypothetical protein
MPASDEADAAGGLPALAMAEGISGDVVMLASEEAPPPNSLLKRSII